MPSPDSTRRQQAQATDTTTRRARALRSSMSLAEVRLWLRLRRDQLGVRFNRQRPLGPYIADFYCHEAKLVVEVDGLHHDRPEQRTHDRARDAWMEVLGIRVLRIPADEIMRNDAGVAAWIKRIAAEREGEAGRSPPPASRTRPPPPRCGGGCHTP